MMDTQTERAATRVALDNAAQVANPSSISKGVRNLISVRNLGGGSYQYSEGFVT